MKLTSKTRYGLSAWMTEWKRTAPAAQTVPARLSTLMVDLENARAALALFRRQSAALMLAARDVLGGDKADLAKLDRIRKIAARRQATMESLDDEVLSDVNARVKADTLRLMREMEAAK